MAETDDLNLGHHRLSPEFYLPEELVITDILLNLPIKSLLRFKSVSKRWYSIISSPYFARLHLKKSTSSNKNVHLLINHKTCFLSFDYASYVGGVGENWDCSPFNDEGDILNEEHGLARIIKSSFPEKHSQIFVVGSCDGLLCLKTRSRYLYIWNPGTLECRKIFYPKGARKHDVVWGFGYVTSANEYKVVRIGQNRNNSEKIIEVYSLSGNNTWTGSQEELQGYGDCPRLTGLGVSVNDVIYWTMSMSSDEDVRDICWCIIGFDLVAGKLKNVPLPKWQTEGFQYPPLMYVTRGYFYAYWYTNDNQAIELGLFKEEDSGGSWTRLLMLNITHWFALPDSWNKNTIMLVDPDELTEHVPSLTIPTSRNILNYTESLVSPFVALKENAEN